MSIWLAGDIISRNDFLRTGGPFRLVIHCETDNLPDCQDDIIQETLEPRHYCCCSALKVCKHVHLL